MRKITERVYYVGVNDRTTHLFERLWPVPLGVSYNSYLVRGDSATALIDGVELAKVDDLVAALDSAYPDYLVVNHMEPDHSGSIGILHKIFPQMKIVGNAVTATMLRGFYNIPDEVLHIVRDNDTLALGGITLQFRLTPMVHWPETMMTYADTARTLFTGDAFGCFGALNGAIVDRDMDTAHYYPEMVRYYACIVGKYGTPVQKAMAKVSDLAVDYICPTHGPVWHDEAEQVSALYSRLSRYEGEKGVTVVYGSMYGNTARLAEAVAERLAERGIRHIAVHDLCHSHLSYILADIFSYQGLVLAAPTYSNTLFPPMETLLSAMSTRDVRNRVVGVIGTHSWAPQSLKKIEAALASCNLLDPEIPSLSAKHAPDSADIEACHAIADALAAKLGS